MIKWPSIEQFKSVVKNVQHRAIFVGLDDIGDVIVDRTRKAPKLKFEGTVKLHGTNAAVSISPSTELWCQSRENIITPEKDNAGFAMFVHGVQDIFQNIATDVVSKLDDSEFTSVRDVAIYGEWCGGNIQKGVAISQLPKMFVIFGIALVDDEGIKTYITKDDVKKVTNKYSDIYKVSVDQITSSGHNGIYCIYDFQTFEVEIDFENPHEIQNELVKLTDFVEEQCPVGFAFNVNGIGEGIVWRCIEEGYEDSGYWFKVKGEKHSNSKVKTTATVDVERINNIKELAERLANNGRLEQMTQSVFDTLNGGEVDIKRTGDFIKAVMSDVAKEDLDIVAESGFNMKEVSGPIAKICRDFIMKVEV
jgi:hypothetical protein